MKLTLNDVDNLIDTTTAETTINNNSAAIETAIENTLSLDGTAPNQMQSNLDMNSKQILNLPNPATNLSPLRLQDLATFTGGGIVSSLPAGGTTGQALQKTSGTDYAVGWATPISLNNPVFTGTVTAPLIVGGSAAGDDIVIKGTSNGSPSGDTATVQASDITLRNISGTTNVNVGVATATSGQITIAGSTSGSTILKPTSVASGTLTFPAATDTLVGRATTDTLTNKTFNSTGTGNVLQVSGITVSAGQYPGEPTTGNATAGNVGEYIEAILVSGSATALTTNTAKTVTSISLTAGDWDVDALGYVVGAGTTNFTQFGISISGTTNTLDATTGKINFLSFPAFVPGAVAMSVVIPPYRISLSATTTVFLIAQATFTVSTASAYGIVRARRVR